MKKILISSMLVCVLIASMLILAGCGKDKLAGKWSDAVDDMYNATFEFDGKGNVTYVTEYAEGKGTYKIKDDKVTISLDIWTKPIEYKFEFNDKKLTLTATNGYSPNYKELKKQK